MNVVQTKRYNVDRKFDKCPALISEISDATRNSVTLRYVIKLTTLIKVEKGVEKENSRYFMRDTILTLERC